jgi:hypothetical protein
MEPPGFRVIVIRAWPDAGSLRIRLLADGDSPRQWIVGSIAEARDVVGSLLAELLAAPPRAEFAERPTMLPGPQGS